MTSGFSAILLPLELLESLCVTGNRSLTPCQGDRQAGAPDSPHYCHRNMQPFNTQWYVSIKSFSELLKIRQCRIAPCCWQALCQDICPGAPEYRTYSHGPGCLWPLTLRVSGRGRMEGALCFPGPWHSSRVPSSHRTEAFCPEPSSRTGRWYQAIIVTPSS